MVSSHYAGLACPDFPTCNGLWVPPLEGLVMWQFLHRLLSFVVLGLAFLLLFSRWQMTRVRWLFVLVSLQIALGIANVLLGLPFWIRIAHLGTGVLIFLMAMALTHEIRSSLHRVD